MFSTPIGQHIKQVEITTFLCCVQIHSFWYDKLTA